MWRWFSWWLAQISRKRAKRGIKKKHGGERGWVGKRDEGGRGGKNMLKTEAIVTQAHHRDQTVVNLSLSPCPYIIPLFLHPGPFTVWSCGDQWTLLPLAVFHPVFSFHFATEGERGGGGESKQSYFPHLLLIRPQQCFGGELWTEWRHTTSTELQQATDH